MTRIFHVADTHIGYSAYRKMDEATGLNQREVDTYASFKQFIDRAVAEKPDVILHAGDLFDSVRPTNRAISFVLEQLLRLNEAKIPFVVISGNHETPRLKETGSVFSLFEHIPHVHVVYNNHYELVAIGDVRIHAIPHCDDIEGEKQKLLSHNDPTGLNIALLHASVYGAGKQTFLMDEFNEQLISIHELTGFDYIALGHYHGYTRVRDDVYYAGSTERFSFNEVNEAKGFLKVQLSKENEEREVTFHELETRAMVDLEPVVCTNRDKHEIKRAITDRIKESNPQDKVVRLKVLGIPLAVYHTLDFDDLKQLTRAAVHFEIKYEFRRDNESLTAEQPSFRSLHTEFEHFMEQYSAGTEVDKKRLKALGLQYMQEEERENEE